MPLSPSLPHWLMTDLTTVAWSPDRHCVWIGKRHLIGKESFQVWGKEWLEKELLIWGDHSQTHTWWTYCFYESKIKCCCGPWPKLLRRPGGNACSITCDHRKSLLAPGRGHKATAVMDQMCRKSFQANQRTLEQTQGECAGNEEATSRKNGQDVFGLGLFSGLR